MVHRPVSSPKIRHSSVFGVFKLVSIRSLSSNRGFSTLLTSASLLFSGIHSKENFPLDNCPIAISALASTLGVSEPYAAYIRLGLVGVSGEGR